MDPSAAAQQFEAWQSYYATQGSGQQQQQAAAVRSFLRFLKLAFSQKHKRLAF